MPNKPARATVALLGTIALIVAMSSQAVAASHWPQTAPNDPSYAPAERNPVGYAPSDEQTYLYSFLPKSAPLATDPEGAAGMSVDRAWRDYTIGRADTK